MKRAIAKAMPSDMTRAIIVWGLSAACLVTALCYAYLVNKAVLQAVETHSLDVKMSAISSNLNQLQTTFLSLENGITLSEAATLGLTEAQNPAFITSKPLGRALSLRNDL